MKRSPPLRLPVLAALSLAVSLVATLVLLGGASAPAGAVTLSPANGQGSTYAALAFQEWTQSVQNQGLNLNYTPTSSPAGLEAYSQNTADFAGTEAEFSELLPGQPSTPPRADLSTRPTSLGRRPSCTTPPSPPAGRTPSPRCACRP